MADMASSLASLLQVPGMQELFNQAITTQRQQMPLRTAVTQQAANMLPGAAFGGGAVPNIAAIAPANYVTPAPQSSVLGNLLKALAAGGAGLAAANAASGGNLMNALKKLFGGGGGGGISNPFTPSTPGSPLTPGNPYNPFDNPSYPVGTGPGGLLTSDPGSYYNPNTGSGAYPTDPSGGTGIGPGMQAYYDSGAAGGDDSNSGADGEY